MSLTRSERFWAKVAVGAPDECWPWLGSKIPKGYGRFKADTGVVYAHRFVYELMVGPIPPGYTIDHVRRRGCTRTDCVNPAHLEAVPMRENLMRGDGFSAVNARKTHCPRGHPYDQIVRRRSGEVDRRCSICNRESVRRCRSTSAI